MGRTPQPALSKSPPVTPTVDQNNFARPEEISVSPDLSLDCSPDSSLIRLTPRSLHPGLCPEAANRLQEMKHKYEDKRQER
uniref:Uncharacterized protein n=1 Tax=Populus trichocarpa TaxID=3694 RepID=U5GKA3_POPTR